MAPEASAGNGSAPSRGTHAASSLLTPDDAVFALVDHQPAMLAGVQSHDRTAVVSHVAALAKVAKAFGVPTVLSTIDADNFSGPILNQIREVFPHQEVIDRSSMNAFEDEHFVRAIEATGRTKLVIAGLWTEVCVAFPTLSALESGYEVYVVTDASGGVSVEAHEMAVQRMTAAGATPLNWLTVLLELQRDWARKETYDATGSVILEHGGAYGGSFQHYMAHTAQAEAAKDTVRA